MTKNVIASSRNLGYGAECESKPHATMTTESERSRSLDEEIAETEAKLEYLKEEIAEIGEPAAHALSDRLKALEIEENALKRNITEMRVRGKPDAERMRKAKALLDHIEREEEALEHEADFLHQSPPSSVQLAFEAGNRLYHLGSRGIKRVLGDHHPLGRSVFVNHTTETLKEQYDLHTADEEDGKDAPAQ
jgi:hypothetical protein